MDTTWYHKATMLTILKSIFIQKEIIGINPNQESK